MRSSWPLSTSLFCLLFTVSISFHQNVILGTLSYTFHEDFNSWHPKLTGDQNCRCLLANVFQFCISLLCSALLGSCIWSITICFAGRQRLQLWRTTCTSNSEFIFINFWHGIVHSFCVLQREHRYFYASSDFLQTISITLYWIHYF